MLIPILATAIRLLWVMVEFPYLRRNRIKAKQNWDKHSAQLWDVANAMELVGMMLGFASTVVIKSDHELVRRASTD